MDNLRFSKRKSALTVRTSFYIDFQLTKHQELEPWSLVLSGFRANWFCTKVKSSTLFFIHL